MIHRVSCHLSYFHDITISVNILPAFMLAERADMSYLCSCMLHACRLWIFSPFFTPFHVNSFYFTYLRHLIRPLISCVAFPKTFSIHLFNCSYESPCSLVQVDTFSTEQWFSAMAVKYRNPGSTLRNSNSRCFWNRVWEYLIWKLPEVFSLASRIFQGCEGNCLESLTSKSCAFLYKYQKSRTPMVFWWPAPIYMIHDNILSPKHLQLFLLSGLHF